MSVFNEVVRHAELAWGLWGFYGWRITLDQARDTVRRRLAEREGSFLDMVERGIYRYPRSPYLPLLRRAGCDLADLRALVRARGLEGALRALREAGVYIAYDEFKGQRPVVRGDLEVSVSRQSFDNPALRRTIEVTSSGTTGPPTVLRRDLAHLAARTPHLLLAYDAHGMLGAPTAVWRGVIPESSGVSNMLRGALIGQVPKRWFSVALPDDVTPPLRHRLMTLYVVGIGRLRGVPVPWPEPLALEGAHVVARWMAEQLARHGRCLVRCYPSQALRVGVAARAHGLDLAGAAFMGGGEPATPGKVAAIRRSGARWIASYGISESGHVGMGCAAPVDGTDVHLFADTLAIVQYPRHVPEWDVSVDAFYLTSLQPAASKIMLNVETDDYGIIETRSCGCPLEAIGFSAHVREVYSFRKLTSEGLTLVGTELIRLLEEVLPSRFGGTPLDYQLLEEEDTGGQTRLTLLVSPRVALADEEAVVRVFLGGLTAGSQGILRAARTIRVRRAEPMTSGRGKLMPLNLLARRRASAGTGR